MTAAYTFIGDWREPLVATAIHAGHDLRPEVAEHLILEETNRLREEDPHTERIAELVSDSRVIRHRSRFEVDLNRPREKAIYRTPADAWELEMWDTEALADDLVAGSLQGYDEFYAELASRLDALAEQGPFVLYDVHSYNHRRDGAGSAAAPEAENPQINVGTGTLDERFAPVVEAFMTAMAAQQIAGEQPDVRENVRFQGGELSAWVHRRYPGRGCALALEFKKTFMDEWTGEVDEAMLADLAAALAATREPVLAALASVPAADWPPA